MKKYTVYIIYAYEEVNATGQFTDSTELQLIDTSVENALKRAKKIIDKPNYFVKTIIENYV